MSATTRLNPPDKTLATSRRLAEPRYMLDEDGDSAGPQCQRATSCQNVHDSGALPVRRAFLEEGPHALGEVIGMNDNGQALVQKRP